MSLWIFSNGLLQLYEMVSVVIEDIQTDSKCYQPIIYKNKKFYI